MRTTTARENSLSYYWSRTRSVTLSLSESQEVALSQSHHLSKKPRTLKRPKHAVRETPSFACPLYERDPADPEDVLIGDLLSVLGWITPLRR